VIVVGMVNVLFLKQRKLPLSHLLSLYHICATLLSPSPTS